ncbi:MAG: integrase family protein [Deltaproteobacteria bacterium]|nr:integrase family protein [Deltaproteobacteria bacterium]
MRKKDMPVIHITKTSVEELTIPASGRVDYSDDKLKGFGVRVSPTSISFYACRRVNGRLVRTKIDTFDKITVEKARKRAKEILLDMEKGIDPNQVKKERIEQAETARQEEEKVGKTLQACLDEYLQKGRLKPRTIETYQDLCRLYLADWLQRPAEEITRDMVRIRHLEIASGERGRRKLTKKTPTASKEAAPPVRREAAANNCMRTLRAVLNHAFEDDEGGTLYRNPVNILSSKKRKAWFDIPPRENLVKNSDLPAWYKSIMSLKNTDMRDYLLFLLFTGSRRSETELLTWAMVDFPEDTVTFVNSDTKNGQTHTIPMSDFLRDLLWRRKERLQTELSEARAALTGKMTMKQQQRAHGRVALAESRLNSQYVFPGEGKTGHLTEPRRGVDAVTAATGIYFTCHDLRRTFETTAESLELSAYALKALVNHKRSANDVTGGYIIMSVDRLREPVQRIADAIQDRIKRQYGQVVQMQAAQ